ncbi:MAG: hypothetical protein JWP52_2684 [Rhizobacter sp.]|nr:hypothetical protein [Rhizobacter sp.]
MHNNESASVSAALSQRIHRAITEAGGWLPFDRFMAMALYTPGLGYYASGSRQFGAMPSSGSDFVTAPELSPLFGRALSRQVAQALQACEADEVWEFGAGSGALANQLLDALGKPGTNQVRKYTIVDLSGSLRQRQQETLARFGDVVHWVDALPDALHGVVVGNEVLDAMPVQLLHWNGAQWFERGVVSVVLDGGVIDGAPIDVEKSADTPHDAPIRAFAWGDRPTDLRPPVDTGFAPDTTIEIHPQAQAFIATLAERLTRGAAFFIDYGFPEREYYHPQRLGGTLMCHRGHLADINPLADVGYKDITAHVDFTGIAVAGQDAGLDVLGYTSQARFLLNCGLLADLKGAGPRELGRAQMLLAEHEMGELFKVLGFARGAAPSLLDAPLGFLEGDRTHTL